MFLNVQEFVRNSCVFDKERRRQAGVGIVLWHFSFHSLFTVACCSDIFPCCPDSFRILLSSPRPPLPGLAGSSTTVVPAKPCHYSSPPREYIYLTHFIIISLIEMKGINKNLQKLHFPDSIEPMQKVLENSCQSCKKKWQYLGKILYIYYIFHPYGENIVNNIEMKEKTKTSKTSKLMR